MDDVISKLPQTVAVTTEGGSITESQVLWNPAPVKGSYDPTVKTAQTFKLSGVLNLPDAVSNPDELTAEIEVTVNAVKKYKVTVNGGSGSGEYEEKTTVPVVLTEVPADKVFTGWSIDKKNVLLNNPAAKSTFFTMPSEKVVVTANYRDKIANVALTGDVPKAGEALPTEVNCVADGVTATLAWTPSDTVAGYNKSYTAIVRLKADSASFYEFADDVSVTVNGNPVGSDNIAVNADKTITITYEITTDKAKLTGIEPLTAISGIAHGTAIADMPLPGFAVLNTEDGTKYAKVTWSNTPSSGSYDNDNTEAQTFTLEGTVTLPDDVDNSDDVSLTVSIGVTVSEADKVGAPVANIPGGTYPAEIDVTLTSTTDGASIYYTTDESEPTTESTLYEGAIKISGAAGAEVPTTVKAIAVKDDMQPSDVVTLEYNIAIPEPTYALTVTGGSGSGEYKAGETVTIMANAADKNKTFAGWEVSGIESLEAKETVTFIMPAETVTVTAKYNDKITQLNCTITEPQAGEKLVETITFDAAGIGKSLMYWMTGDTKARYGTEYWAFASVMPDSANFYEFADDVIVTVNNVPALSVEKSSDGSLTFYASYKTEKAKLSGIENPADITGVENGTALADILPKTVKITTNDADTNKAEVVWNTENVDYDPSKAEEQTFTVSGSVTLPENVENEGNISTDVTVKVTVKARIIPKAEIVIGDNIAYTDNTMTVSVNVENPTEETENGVMIAALYNESGVCVQVVRVSDNKAVLSRIEKGYVKVFLWDSLGTLKPILNPAQKNLTVE